MRSTTDIIDLLQKTVPMRTARALSRTIMDLVVDGELQPGARMPTVRAVGKAFSMSATSVAMAWRELVDWKVLETRRRGGSTVIGPPRAPRATRFTSLTHAAQGTYNLAYSLCDPELLPSLEPALIAAAKTAAVDQNVLMPISPSLRDALAPVWPFKPSFWLATHGGICGVEMALRTTVRPGDRVLVETPCLSRILDILDDIGATIVPIEMGGDGPSLSMIEKALRGRPVALVYQPAGNYPTGRSVGAQWVEQAAALLRNTHMAIIELLLAPFLNRAPIQSIGRLLPHAVIHIQSFTFFFGRNMGVGVAGGSDYYIDRMWQNFTFSSRWVSRILQDAVAFHLTDERAKRQLGQFVSECHRRRATFIDALHAEGFAVEHGDSPYIWLPVDDEQQTVRALLADGITIHGGSNYSSVPLEQPHVVLNAMLLEGGQQSLAQKLKQTLSH